MTIKKNEPLSCNLMAREVLFEKNSKNNLSSIYTEKCIKFLDMNSPDVNHIRRLHERNIFC